MDTEIETTGGDAEHLYDADFYAWTQQAALLRLGCLEHVDATHLLEEIETLGRKEVAELRARLRILAAYLLKTRYQPKMATRSWSLIIFTQRIEIADHIADNPSLRPKLEEAFAKTYKDARDLAASETGLPLKTFPAQPPFSCGDAISRSWQPSEIATPGG